MAAATRKILYLVSSASKAATDLIPQSGTTDQIDVVLLQGVSPSLPSGSYKTYILADGVQEHVGERGVPVVSYSELLRMIFEADTVMAL